MSWWVSSGSSACGGSSSLTYSGVSCRSRRAGRRLRGGGTRAAAAAGGLGRGGVQEDEGPQLLGHVPQQLLRDGHVDVELADVDLRRLAAWIDCNAVFHGSYDPADQVRRLADQQVAMPEIQ
jgi:hypothetical protein